jgi:hypothetical protein
VYLAHGSFQRELFSVPVDGSATAVVLNGPLVVGGGVGLPSASSEFLAITPDSRLVVYWAAQSSSSRADLFVAPIDGHAAAVRLNEPPGETVRSMALAPGGTRVVYIAGSLSTGNDLFSVPLDASSPPVRLHPPFTGSRGVALYTRSSLVFTPDGSRVLYLADAFQSDVFELFSAPVDGSSSPAQLSDFAVTGTVGEERHVGNLSKSVQVSADGLRAVFAASRIYSRVIDGAAPAIPLHPPLVPFQEILGLGVSPVSPIAVFGLESSDPTQLGRLYSAPLDGSTPPLELDDRLANAFSSVTPLFASGGARVIYSALQGPEGGVIQGGIRSVPVDGSSPALWLNPPSTGGFTANVSPDGNRVVFLSTAQPFDPVTWSVLIAPADGSSAAEMLNAPLPAGRIVLGLFPDPTGRRVLYTANRAEPDAFELFSDPIDPLSPPGFRHR